MIRTKKTVAKFNVGDEVIVSHGERQMRGTIILMGTEFGERDDNVMKVEDIDEVVHDVMATQCQKICIGCNGTGELFYEAYQSAGEIVDADSETCRMCRGTGVLED